MLAALWFDHGAVVQCWSENKIAMCFCKKAPDPFMSHSAGSKRLTAMHNLPMSTSGAHHDNTFWFCLVVFFNLVKTVSYFSSCFCVCMCVHIYNTYTMRMFL